MFSAHAHETTHHHNPAIGHNAPLQPKKKGALHISIEVFLWIALASTVVMLALSLINRACSAS